MQWYLVRIHRHFNPLPPHGGRLCVVLVFPPDCTFQSTPSTRRETVQPILHWVRQVNLNPLPPHGGRLLANRNLVAFYHFNPLPPHGGRQYQIMFRYRQLLFQSTPSTRRETKSGTPLDQFIIFQSTPSTRRETFSTYPYCVIVEISIHSLHTEGDNRTFAMNSTNIQFQSTPSTRRETEIIWGYFSGSSISIHSLHTEGDDPPCVLRWMAKDFNPLPPHGGRHRNILRRSEWRNFNPLPPHGGRLDKTTASYTTADISIHSLHTEGDSAIFIIPF